MSPISATSEVVSMTEGRLGDLFGDDESPVEEPEKNGHTAEAETDVEDESEESEEGDNIGPGSGLSDIKEVRYVDMPELPAIETPDGKIRCPKRGIRPFLARLFADAAELDKSKLTTKIEVNEGRIDEKILVDPESEVPVKHEPARVVRRWPVLHRLDQSSPDPIEDEEEEYQEPDAATKIALFGGMVIVCVCLPIIGWGIGSGLGVPLLGGLLGLFPALIDGHEARDGYINYEPANQHYRRARATLVDLQREQADGKTMEEYREMAWKERARSAKDARDLAEDHDRTLTEELLSEQIGYDLVGPETTRDLDGPTPDAGGDSDDG